MFANSVLEPPPPVIPLLTMIRLNEGVIAEVQKRDCSALENFVFGLRLRFWPVFQNIMTEHVASVNKLTEAATGGYFKRATAVTNANVQNVGRFVSTKTTIIMLFGRSQIDTSQYFPHLLSSLIKRKRR